MNTNEAILNKLIELGYLLQCEAKYYFKHSGGERIHKGHFNPLEYDSDYLVLQRALFVECATHDYVITISANFMIIDHLCGDEIYQGDTSRESFVAAFEKVVGI